MTLPVRFAHMLISRLVLILQMGQRRTVEATREMKNKQVSDIRRVDSKIFHGWRDEEHV